jgi:hypothetical protein
VCWKSWARGADIIQSEQSSTTENVRYHAIDSLRAAMISVVMFGHALLPYVTVPRRFKDPATHLGFDAAAIFLYGFAMPVFFVTAGFTAALLHRRKGVRSLARSRFQPGPKPVSDDLSTADCGVLAAFAADTRSLCFRQRSLCLRIAPGRYRPFATW